jgi:hypothetical protein
MAGLGWGEGVWDGVKWNGMGRENGYNRRMENIVDRMGVDRIMLDGEWV